MGPKLFGPSKKFGLSINCVGQVQIVLVRSKISPEKSNLNLTKMTWSQLKQFWPDQTNLYQFWTYRRTGHKSRIFPEKPRSWRYVVRFCCFYYLWQYGCHVSSDWLWLSKVCNSWPKNKNIFRKIFQKYLFLYPKRFLPIEAKLRCINYGRRGDCTITAIVYQNLSI